jgi:hypothetical protein
VKTGVFSISRTTCRKRDVLCFQLPSSSHAGRQSACGVWPDRERETRLAPRIRVRALLSQRIDPLMSASRHLTHSAQTALLPHVRLLPWPKATRAHHPTKANPRLARPIETPFQLPIDSFENERRTHQLPISQVDRPSANVPPLSVQALTSLFVPPTAPGLGESPAQYAYLLFPINNLHKSAVASAPSPCYPDGR